MTFQNPAPPPALSSAYRAGPSSPGKRASAHKPVLAILPTGAKMNRTRSRSGAPVGQTPDGKRRKAGRVCRSLDARDPAPSGWESRYHSPCKALTAGGATAMRHVPCLPQHGAARAQATARRRIDNQRAGMGRVRRGADPLPRRVRGRRTDGPSARAGDGPAPRGWLSRNSVTD